MTGVDIKKATQNLNSELLIVLNGDSFVKLDLEKISKFHREKGADITVLSVYMKDASRYGLLKLSSDSKVETFCEKKINSQGQINSGVYFFNSNLVKLKVYAFISEEDFIDIGVPEDYERAQRFFAVKR